MRISHVLNERNILAIAKCVNVFGVSVSTTMILEVVGLWYMSHTNWKQTNHHQHIPAPTVYSIL